MKIFKYYYYRLFTYFEDGTAIPFFKTYCVMLCFVFINILTLLKLILAQLNQEKFMLFTGQGLDKLWWLLLILPGYLLFKYELIRSGSHDRIIEEFKNETKKNKYISAFFTVLYFLISLSFFLVITRQLQ
ncbi:hypothetical protein [Pedobacter aquatilis]|uniref:hypothetical protein n=1 Tax=Pedobacter aquatilis TaxID=351343 RepID=UPI00292F41F0|nr:hypothetical protein [Pedobacter aquatilis]